MESKIISTFPCCGKTYYAKNNKHAIDLESSEYLFFRDGFEDLDKEEFKGVSNRKRNPEGISQYVEAIEKTFKEKKYKYIFISMHPEIIEKLLENGHIIHYIIPIPSEQTILEFEKRARNRGNSEEWITIIKEFINKLPTEFLSEKYFNQIFIQLIPPNLYLSQVLN